MAFSTYAERHGTWQIGVFADGSNEEGEAQTDRGGTGSDWSYDVLAVWNQPPKGGITCTLAATLVIATWVDA